jgi:flagellar protein FliO/FliZ
MQPSVWSFLMLILVVGIIPLALWVLKRLQILKTGGQKQIDLVHQLSVGTRERIAIVHVHGRQFLIGLTPQNISLLAELAPKVGETTEQRPGNTNSGSLAFAEALANTRAGIGNDK